MLKNKQSGNALFLILIGIFLLGGLTVFMSRTGSQTEDTGSSEQRSILVSDVMKYAAGIQNSIQILLSRGCSENQISFDDNTTTTNGYENTNSPSDLSCHVFFPQGGGQTWKSTIGSGTVKFAANRIRNSAATQDHGTIATELIFFYKLVGNSYNSLCVAFNKQVGNSFTIFESGGQHNEVKFIGDYTDTGNTINKSTISPLSGCFCNSADNTCATATDYLFYHTLIKR